MSKSFWLRLGLVVLVALALWFTIELFRSLNTKPEIKTIQIGRAEVRAEVADTDYLRQRGLQGRDELADGRGMLFVFNSADYYTFWMKNTRVPLDIIWINNDRVVYIRSNVQPDDGAKTYEPTVKANFVLEVPAGFTDARNIDIGTEVKGL